MTPLERYMTADHEAMDRLLDRVAGGARLDRDAFERFRTRLLRHIAIEEKILFAAARRAAGGAPLSRAARLRRDHAAVTTLLVPTPDLELVGEIRRILEPHDGLEEGPGGVYAECVGLLGDDLHEVLARAQGYPAVKVAAHFDGRGTVRTAAEALARAERRPVAEERIHAPR